MSVGIDMNTRTLCFPANDCTVAKSSKLFISTVSGFKVVADGCMFSCDVSICYSIWQPFQEVSVCFCVVSEV